MKKFLLLVAMLILFVGVVGYAKEIEGNPDKRPSIGLSSRNFGSSTDYISSSGWFAAKTTGTSAEHWLIGDIRLPVSRYTTFYGAIGYGTRKSVLDENFYFNKQESNSTGYLIDFGVRFYLD